MRPEPVPAEQGRHVNGVAFACHCEGVEDRGGRAVAQPHAIGRHDVQSDTRRPNGVGLEAARGGVARRL